MNTQISRTTHILNSDVNVFFSEQKKTIDYMQEKGMIPEIHYQMVVQPDGELIHSSLIFGREKN